MTKLSHNIPYIARTKVLCINTNIGNAILDCKSLQNILERYLIYLVLRSPSSTQAKPKNAWAFE